MNGRILGLDLSLRSTGYAIRELDGLTISVGCIGYELPRTSPEQLKIERLIDIRNKVIELISQNNVRAIGIERYAYGARGAQNDLAELHGVLKVAIIEQFRVIPHYVSVQAARKHTVGKGSGLTKEQFRKKIEEVASFNLGSTDEADAWSVSEFIRHMRQQERGFV